MNFQQPKPDSKKYSDLIREIERGFIKIPKFQRDFVWSLDKTAKLLDSILKGYPIGTFIFWQTIERINDIKNIGGVDLPVTPEGHQVQYVLDGQQRITSLFAAYCRASIQKRGEKKITDYSNIFVNLDTNISENDGQVITTEPTGDKYLSLSDVLTFDFAKGQELADQFTHDELNTINKYCQAFQTYEFSTVVLRKDDMDSAIEVFTRINTGGQTLTLFEIMSAKTYDEKREFDMQARWEDFEKQLRYIHYEGISNTVVLHLLSLVLSRTKECKRKTILALEKQAIIDIWDSVIYAIEDGIDYFKTAYRIPVSQILPYDALLTSFAYFFFKNKKQPSSQQFKYLEEFFWRMSLSYRYSSAAESKLAQDIKRIDLILNHERPDYSDVYVYYLESSKSLIDVGFSAGDSFCKAILCLLAYQEPKDWQNNGKIILDNSWLKRANSKNFHHFFPKSYLKKKNTPNGNSIVNITYISDRMNKRVIRARAPSSYISDFKDGNSKINKALNSHLIDLSGFGIESDDYEIFLKSRSECIFSELKARIDLSREEPTRDEVNELIVAGENYRVEFKSTMRYDLYQKCVNKKLEFVIAKTIAAFLNSEGGNLFIGIDDNQNALGLSEDFRTLKKENEDGFELHLIGIIKKHIGLGYIGHINISFPQYDDITICRIKVGKSGTPVFTLYEAKQGFFVRSGCSSQPLSRLDQSNYIKQHWNN